MEPFAPSPKPPTPETNDESPTEQLWSDAEQEDAEEYNRDYLLAQQELEDFEDHQFGE